MGPRADVREDSEADKDPGAKQVPVSSFNTCKKTFLLVSSQKQLWVKYWWIAIEFLQGQETLYKS